MRLIRNIVLVAWLLSMVTAQNCALGCLKCSSAGACVLCDVTNQFVLSSNTCIVANLTNCQLPTQAGGCALCKTSYYIDSNTQKCLPVAVAKVVTNCAIYSSTQLCTTCANNFYINGTACVAVNSTIANCLSYTSTQTCYQCATGYVPSADATSCVAAQASSNCLRYTYIACGNCSAGFFLDPNNYFAAFSSTSTLSLWYSTQILPTTSPMMVQTACRATTVTNCAVFTAFNVCQTCATGYYLSNNQCIINPLPVISGCLAYSSLTTCIQCQSGMFLSNATSCVVNTNIANCVAFNGSAAATTCVQCSSNFFLQNNICSSRSVSTNITNCAQTQISADLCQTCADGFNITSDFRACLPTIANCAVFTTSTFQSAALQCATCVNGYYVVSSGSSTSCVLGTLSNCLVYSAGANTCSVCANGFYISNQLCVQHVSIQSCQVYSPSVANSCSNCNPGFYAFSFTTVCVAVTAKTNCATYTADGNTCTSCTTGNYLNNGVCLALPSPVSGCVVYSGATCTTCGPGMMLNGLIAGSPACSLPFDYITTYCATYSTPTATPFSWLSSGSNPLLCVNCATNGITITPRRDEAICVLTSQGLLFSAGFTFSSIANCYRYGLSATATPVIVCQQCANGFYISGYWASQRASTATSCISSCSTSGTTVSNMILLDDFFGFVNICVPFGSSAGQINLSNCQVYARETAAAGTISDWKCNLAATGSILVHTLYTADVIPRDIPGPSNPTSLGAVTGPVHGFFLGELNVRPSIFMLFRTGNYTITSTPASNFANCNMAFTPSSSGTSNLASISCMRCTFGSYQMTSGTAGTSNFPTCVAMNTCSGYQVGGLPSYLQDMSSCHICVSSGGVALFPTIYFEYARDAASSTFNIIYQYSIRSTGTLNVFECAAAPTWILTTNTQVSGGTGATAPSVPSNCAYFGVLSSVVSRVVTPTGNINNFCMACATNFFPIYATPGGTNYMPAYAVASCNAAPNCDTTVTIGPFNACTRCATVTTGNTVVYYAFTDTLLTNCQPSKTKNCLILVSSPLPSTSTVNSCLVCVAGNFLNADGFCESLTIPNMTSTSSFTPNFYGAFYDATAAASITAGFDKIQVRIRYLLSFSASTYGLANGSNSPCQTGYTLSTPSSQAPTLCVVSTYIQNQTFPTSGSKFIANCVAYLSPSTLLVSPSSVYPCVACLTNFIPTADYSSCVNAVANCLVAQSGANSMLCATCFSNFFNANGICYNSTITNCLTYVNTPTSTGQTAMLCAQCNPGFMLASNQLTCTQGQIANCITYAADSTTTCTVCASGYTLITLSSGRFYCYPFSASLNATALASGTATGGGSNNGTIVATSCVQSGSNVFGLRQWTSLSTSGWAQTICMPFVGIANCALYSQNNTSLVSNTFQCLNCSSGFFLAATGACTARTVTATGCTTYSLTSDTCTACQAGFFINTNGTACVAFPSGIFACVVYSSPVNCTRCSPPYFAANGTCTLSTVVPNCLIYSANNTCSNCSIGFFLTSPTVCTSATAQNCLTYTSVSACATCAAGFGLQTVGGNVNCVTTALANCVNSTTVFPFTCLQCSSNYFPNAAGVCTLVPTAIPNCLIYASATTCLTCTQNAVLSIDGTSCNSTFYSRMVDPNCVQNSLMSTPQCSACAFGYFFSSGACTACSTNSLTSGCLACNPYNNTVCLLCAPGFYQVANGTCLKAVLPSTNTTSNTSSNSTNQTNTTAGVSLPTARTLLVAAMMVWLV